MHHEVPTEFKCPHLLPATRPAAEMKAAAAMASIQGMMAKSCTVVRGGSERTIDPALLVPGDVVRLRLGERVPADLRVVQTRDLKTEVRVVD